MSLARRLSNWLLRDRLIPLHKTIGFVLLLIVLYRLDMRTLFHAILAIKPFQLFAGMFIIIVLLFLRIPRNQLLLKGQNIDLPAALSAAIYYRSFFWGMVSPGRAGELIRAVYLAGLGLSMTKGVVNVLIDRLLELLSLFFLTGLAGLLLLAALGQQVLAFALFLVALVLAGTVFLLWEPLIKRLMSGASRKSVSVGEAISEALSIRGVHKVAWLTVLIWIAYFFALHIMVSGLGIDISFTQTIFAAGTANIVSAIPITVAGIGTRDTWLICLFAWFGFPPEQAILFSAFILVVYVEFVCLNALWFLVPLDKLKPSTAPIPTTNNKCSLK